ncbi:MAG TPA: hypothetical protein VE326_11130 [Candidatus Binatia bacterium]|nr:hypothetical protein [Candidatus Binatia bacterium]
MPARHTLTSGRVWVWVHGIGALIWTGLCWPGLTTWRNSVPFVVFISLYAIVLSHVVGAVAALSARKADPNDNA